MKMFIQQIEKFNVLENRKKEYDRSEMRLFCSEFSEKSMMKYLLDKWTDKDLKVEHIMTALALNKKVNTFCNFLVRNNFLKNPNQGNDLFTFNFWV